MWKLIALSFLLTSAAAQASFCNTFLSTVPAKVLLRKQLIQLTTPNEDSTERVKLLLKATQESWLNYGRPDRLTTKTLEKIFTDHLIEIQKTRDSLLAFKSRFSSEDEFNKIRGKLNALQNELKEIQSRKYVDQKQIFHWGREMAQLNNYALAVKENRDPHYNPDLRNSYTDYSEQYERISFLPMPYAEFDWRELNDLWIAGVAIAGLPIETHFVDGAPMKPLRFTLHDYGHASSLALRMGFISPLRIHGLYKESLSYKKFRQTQALEKDSRKRALREGILFFQLHDSDSFPFNEPFNKSLLSFKSNIKNKFIQNEAEYGAGFSPSVHFTEVQTEIDWFINTLKWDESQ